MIWINADDYGMTKTISDAILLCFKNGFLTTTTACVNTDYFKKAASDILNTDYYKNVGIHINLTEGKPITEEIKKNKYLCKNGQFYGFPNRNHIFKKEEQTAIYCEIKAQIELFLSTGLQIHHIDSHHHIHNSPGLLPIFKKIMKEFGIEKIRILRNTGRINPLKRVVKYFINTKLKNNSFSSLMGSFDDIKISFGKVGDKIMELMIHPDLSCDGVLIDRKNDDYNCPMGFPIAQIISFLSDKALEVVHLEKN